MTCQACIPGKKWHIFRCYAEQNGSTASRCLLMILQVDTFPTDRAYPKRSRKKHEFHEVNPSQNWGLWWGMVQYGPSTCSNWVDELHCVLLRLASWGCFMALCLPHVPRKCQEIHCGLVYHAASLHRNAMHGNVFGCIRGCDDRDQSFQACDSGRVTRYPAVNIKRCGKGIFFPGNNLQMFGLPHRFVCLRGGHPPKKQRGTSKMGSGMPTGNCLLLCPGRFQGCKPFLGLQFHYVPWICG